VICPTCKVPDATAEDVRDVQIVLAPPATADTGLCAWATVAVSGVRIDGLAARRSWRDGALSVTWPERRAANGARHPIVAVEDDGLRRRVEAVVLAEYLAAARRAGRNRR
jgi:hypothetical protein